jgi:WD40 repeat protein
VAVDNRDRICLCAADTGEEVGEARGHLGAVTGLAFSADGRWLVSGSVDTTALVWDVTALTEPKRRSGPSAREVDALWADLGAADAERASRAL